MWSIIGWSRELVESRVMESVELQRMYSGKVDRDDRVVQSVK